MEEHSQAFSFAFFAPSRETNLLSKFAHFGECTPATAAGADLAIIGSFFNRDSSQLIASADIRSPQDLKGKKVIASWPKSSTTQFTVLYPTECGVTPDDVEIVDIGSGTVADRVNAVLTGNAAATLVASPIDAARAVQKGAVVLLRAEQIMPPDRIANPFIVSRSKMAKQRDAYVRFMKARYTAVARIPTDEQGVKAALADFSKLDVEKDAAILDITYQDFLLKYLDAIPYPSKSALQAQIDTLAEDVPAVVGTTPEKYLDLSIVDELVAAGFMKKP